MLLPNKNSSDEVATLSPIPTPTKAPQACIADESGSFHVAANDTTSLRTLDFLYELETKPMSSEDLTKLLDILERDVVNYIIPTIFPECDISPIATPRNGPKYRLLEQSSIIGIATQPKDTVSRKLSCGILDVPSNDCNVIQGRMTVYYGDERGTDDGIIQRLKIALNDGTFIDSDDSIQHISWRDGAPSTTNEVTNIGTDGNIDYALMGTLIGIFGTIALLCGALYFQRRPRRHLMTADKQDAEAEWENMMHSTGRVT